MLGASAFQVTTAATQLLMVPLFVYSWGIDKYGNWLTLTALLMLLSFSDFGFLNIISNKVNTLSSRFKCVQTQLTWSGILWFATSFSITFIIVGLIYNYWVNLSVMPYGIYWFFFTLSVFLSNTMRSSIGYYKSLIALSFAKVIEIIIIGLALYFTDSFFIISTAYAVAGLIGFIILFRYRFLNIGYKPKINSNPKFYLKSRGKAFFSFLMPAGLTLWLQTSVTLAGYFFTGTEAAIFSTIRSLSRLGVQWVNTINTSYWGRMACLIKMNEKKETAQLIYKTFIMSIAGLLLMLFAFIMFGDVFYQYWTGFNISSYWEEAIIIVIASVFSGLWTNLALPFMASSRYYKFSGFYLLLVLIGLIGLLIVSKYQFLYFLLVIALIELAMLLFVYSKLRIELKR